MSSSNRNIFRITDPLSPVNSPHKVQWRGALMFSLICAWTNSWVNNRDADDLRHHRAHYGVTVMILRRDPDCPDTAEDMDKLSTRIHQELTTKSQSIKSESIFSDTVAHITSMATWWHYCDVIMGSMASQITSLTLVYSTVHSGTDQRKHQSSPSLAFVRGINRRRWIPRAKGQYSGKCFHLMTSSWTWRDFWWSH